MTLATPTSNRSWQSICGSVQSQPVTYRMVCGRCATAIHNAEAVARLLLALIIVSCTMRSPQSAAVEYEITQITTGPEHHFFGYIGHVQTIPWNLSGRYIVALRTTVRDHLPGPEEPADIVLLDTQDDYSVRLLDRTRAWNPQQGTMLYWNPQAAETQFFFNDRDPETGKVFAVLYDISGGNGGARVREYRFDDTPLGNSGVAQQGGFFLGLNYARLARLRAVTGYRGAWDWTVTEDAPRDDGIFKVDVATGEKQLLVSYAQLRDTLTESVPEVDDYALFINHTLCNRNSDRIFFFVRANFGSRLKRIDVPFTIDADGSNLTRQRHIGGHPEWELGINMIGADDDEQVIYDTGQREIVGRIGPPGTFPRPGGDVALSPNASRFVNGHGDKDRGLNFHTILFRQTNQVIGTRGLPIGTWTSGPLRVDPAPRWDRTGRQILVPGLADDPQRTRQLFLIKLHE